MRNSSSNAFLKKLSRSRSRIAAAAALLCVAASAPAWSKINDDVVKIGVLADMSGI